MEPEDSTRWSLPWAEWTQFPPSYNSFFKIHINIILPSMSKPSN
jgi:hypothetical protein